MKARHVIPALLAAGLITVLGVQPVLAQAQAKPARPEQVEPTHERRDRPDHRRPHRERPDRPGDTVRRDDDRARPERRADRPEQARVQRPERSAKR